MSGVQSEDGLVNVNWRNIAITHIEPARRRIEGASYTSHPAKEGLVTLITESMSDKPVRRRVYWSACFVSVDCERNSVKSAL
jgi:hypothetical protein